MFKYVQLKITVKKNASFKLNADKNSVLSLIYTQAQTMQTPHMSADPSPSPDTHLPRNDRADLNNCDGSACWLGVRLLGECLSKRFDNMFL